LHVVAQFTNSALSATAAIADNDIWAVGESSSTNQTLAVHFNGTSWSIVPTPILAASSLAGVSAVASNDVWAVGGQTVSGTSNTLIEHWNGTNWSVVTSPTPSGGGSLTAVTAISSTDVWAVGTQSQISGDLVEHWDGTSWSIVSSPAFTGNDILDGISADATNDVWAVGQNFATPGAVVLHWDGQTWSRLDFSSTSVANLGAVAALSPTNVWAVGARPGPPPGDIAAVVEHWDGASWSFVPSPNPDPIGNLSSLTGIAAISANDICAAGDAHNGPFIEHWNGRKWSLISTPSGVADLNGVTALSDGTVVAVGQGTNSSGVILEN
jgi:hypothetical protein